MQSKLQRPSKVKLDESRKMMACQFNGKEDMRVNQVPVPMITDPTDAIVKVTAASICGMDLSLFHDMIPGMVKGSIIGHESVGIVDSVGPQITNLKKGDRVIISSVIACGQCEYCKRREWSSCETTNPCDEQEKMYGSHTSAVLGTGPTFGGLEGSLAEYVRVPFAQVNLIRIPNNITDKQAVLVSDIASTALHANVLADVKQGDRVAVIGCGPVGMLTQMWAKLRGAEMVIGIDTDQQRLSMVKDRVGSMIVNSKETDVFEAVRKLVPGGPDKVIDCVGSTTPEGALHKAGMMLKMETDSPNIVNMAIRMVRKNGRVTLIGDYMGCTNQFNIGGLMEKNLIMTGGRVSPQNYAEEVMGVMSSGKIDPTVVFTHTIPMSKTDQIWKKLDRHEEGIMKVLILPDELASRVEGVSK